MRTMVWLTTIIVTLTHAFSMWREYSTSIRTDATNSPETAGCGNKPKPIFGRGPTEPACCNSDDPRNHQPSGVSDYRWWRFQGSTDKALLTKSKRSTSSLMRASVSGSETVCPSNLSPVAKTKRGRIIERKSSIRLPASCIGAM